MAAILKILIICMLVISILPFNSGIAQPATNWEITGNTVFVEDENAYLSATPHTVSSSGWVEFIVQPKLYSGNIDVCWGFSLPTVKPTKAEYCSPYWNNWTTSHSQIFENVSTFFVSSESCDFGNDYNTHHYNVTYQRCNSWNEFGFDFECTGYETVTSVVCFDSYSVVGNDYTVYWDTKHSELIKWVDVSGAFSSIKYDYGGMNTWYYKQNFPVVAGESYKLRVFVDMPISTNLTSGKYFWAVKPSSKTIQEAIEQDCFYALDPWYSSSYGKRKQWTITNVDATALTNFPAYINVSDEPEMQADYDDVVFTDSNSVLMPFELENYTASYAEYWVNVTILGSSSVTGWMYYSNDGATSQEDMEGVWDSSYVMVHHLQNMTDSTNYSNDGTNNGATYNQSGRIDGAYDFVPNEYVNCGNDASLNITGAIMVEAWVKPNSVDPAAQRLIWKFDGTLGSHSGYNLHMYSAKIRAQIGNGTTSTSLVTTDNLFVVNTWIHIVMTYDGSTIRVYSNGQFRESLASVALATTSLNLHLGNDYGDDWPLNGTIDEVRISSTARSADWINQSYELVVNQSTWVTWGAEESQVVLSDIYEQIRLLKEAKQMIADMWLFAILFAVAFGLSAYSWLGLGSYFYTDVIAGAMAFIMFFAVAFYSITTLEHAWLAMLTTMFGLVQTLYVSIKVFDIFRSVVEA